MTSILIRLAIIQPARRNTLYIIATCTGQPTLRRPCLVPRLPAVPGCQPRIHIGVSRIVAIKQDIPHAVHLIPQSGVTPLNTLPYVHTKIGWPIAFGLSSKHQWTTAPRHSNGLGPRVATAGSVHIFSTPITSFPYLSPSYPSPTRYLLSPLLLLHFIQLKFISAAATRFLLIAIHYRVFEPIWCLVSVSVVAVNHHTFSR